ncbi:MAG: chorismate mutase [Anaerolineales bacterium]|jgi:chorismate mutase
MPIRGIRGATIIPKDQPEAILAGTQALLSAILEANPTLHIQDLASGLFTVTEDLRSAYPAQAAREMGWTHVPMICSREIPVPGGMSRCIRVLLHWNTDLPQDDIRHVYLGAAASLRPDLTVADGF